MNKEEIIEKTRIALAEEFETDIEKLQPDAPLMQTLNLDSLDMVDIVVLIHENFGLNVTKNDFNGIKTFQDFYDFIIERLNKKA